MPHFVTIWPLPGLLPIYVRGLRHLLILGRVTYFREKYAAVVQDTYDPLKTLGVLGEQTPSSQYFFVLQGAVNISSIAFNNESVMVSLGVFLAPLFRRVTSRTWSRTNGGTPLFQVTGNNAKTMLMQRQSLHA